MKITIVGGGTAGWLAAYFISNAQPNQHQISVVESSKLGIIGAGEGSTGLFLDLLAGGFFPTSVDINEFVLKTDATPKMGIKHVNWGSEPGSYFAPLDTSPTGFTVNDYIFKYILAEYGVEKMHLASKIGLDYENKLYYKYYALHFDGHKVGEFFKSKCINNNVSVFDSVVNKINSDENSNIKSIILEDGFVLESDLFIDCTGFSKLLMKEVNSTWISKKDVLPMNTAMPFILNYSKDEEIQPFTTATALSSGWMWDIPLSTRRGCGYVFDSNFITREDAKREVEHVLGKEITPIKYINFEGGYFSESWKNNVIGFGLSSSFVEPLEATSIHNTIVQLAIFVNEFLDTSVEKTFTPIKQELYNKRVLLLNELTVDFISLHYQGGRKDTKFWKHIKENKIITKTANAILTHAQNKIPGFSILEGMFGSFSIPLANWILAGLGIIKPKQAKEELIKDNRLNHAKTSYESWINNGYR